MATECPTVSTRNLQAAATTEQHSECKTAADLIGEHACCKELDLVGFVRTHYAVRALWTTAALRSIALVWPYAQPRRQAKYYLAVLNSESRLIRPTVYLPCHAPRHRGRECLDGARS